MRPPSDRLTPPEWWEHANEELTCDCEMGATRVKYEHPFTRFVCNSPDCEESYCRVIGDR